MSPSEYQELAEFFVQQLGRHQRETRADMESFRVEIREQLRGNHREIRAFVGVSIESLRAEVRQVADGVAGNRELIEKCNQGLAECNRRIEENGLRIEANSARIDDQSARIDQQSARIDQQTARIDQQTARIEEQTARIDALTERVAGVETTMATRFVDHEHRLLTLEKRRGRPTPP
jgi:chromosome segregation ATPase